MVVWCNDEQARENYQYAGISCMQVGAQDTHQPEPISQERHSIKLKQHDATHNVWSNIDSLDAATCETVPRDVDVIVGNPPWGKNIGVGEDALQIVNSLAKAYPRATAGYIVSDWSFKKLDESLTRQRSEGHVPVLVKIVDHVRVGPCVLVIVRSGDGSSLGPE